MPFNTVKNTSETADSLSLDANAQGGFTIRANGFRVAEIKRSGGKFLLYLPGGLPATGTGAEIENEHWKVYVE